VKPPAAQRLPPVGQSVSPEIAARRTPAPQQAERPGSPVRAVQMGFDLRHAAKELRRRSTGLRHPETCFPYANCRRFQRSTTASLGEVTRADVPKITTAHAAAPPWDLAVEVTRRGTGRRLAWTRPVGVSASVLGSPPGPDCDD